MYSEKETERKREKERTSNVPYTFLISRRHHRAWHLRNQRYIVMSHIHRIRAAVLPLTEIPISNRITIDRHGE